MSYQKYIAELREELREDVAADGIQSVADSYGIIDVQDMTEEEFIDVCIAIELEIAGH